MANERPIFVVGCPRSGTTLLEMILNGHPRLAVAHELSFPAGLAPRRLRPWDRPANADDVIGHPRFDRLELDPEIVRAAVREAAPTTYADFIDAVLRAWARGQGKQRWGDKNPGYLGAIPLLARTFPDSQFIHVIRDGREVAAALEARTWGPPSAVTGAFWWRFKVAHGRRDGRRLPPERYLELRLDRLVADPQGELRLVCEYLGEQYAPEMLHYHERFRDQELKDSRTHLAKPPTPGLRDWTAGLSSLQQRGVESACRPLLTRLGYATPRRSWVALAYAWGVGVSEVARALPAAIARRLRPRRRIY